MKGRNDVDAVYADLIREIMDEGDDIRTRNSDVKRIFGKKIVFRETPLVSLRKTAWKNALREWEFFMSGSTNINDLHPSVRHWWEPWANADGVVPFHYGKLFRNYYGTNDGVDQIALLSDGVRDHPFSRRNVITTWNTADMNDPKCKLTTCHGSLIQTFVGSDGLLSMTMYQRSADVICGLPHNWIQYAAFHLWLCALAKRSVGQFVWIGGDVHVYSQHFDLARRMLEVDSGIIRTPTLCYRPGGSDVFLADEFSLDGDYAPVITERAEMVV